MKYIIQFLIIIAFSFLGEVFHFFIPLPIPASIYGILFLFTALMMKWIKVNQVREVSTLLISVMPMMFIPAAVGLIDSWAIIKSHLLTYIIVTVVSTFIVMATSGFVTQYVIRRDNKKGDEK
ncbi:MULTISPECIES: CidA/LrgA family protein [Prevotella]|nr:MULTISPECIES: CidA/LrgA family protein [Prevotella]MDN5554973.1 CidA/LrgA family protein [Prevotella sp.]